MEFVKIDLSIRNQSKSIILEQKLSKIHLMWLLQI